MASPRRRWIVTLTLLGAVAAGLVMIAWRVRTGDLATRIRIIRAVNEGGGEPLNMANMPAFTWDALHVFGPETPAGRQGEAADVPWYVRILVGLERRSDICLLAFTLGGEYRSHVVLPREKVDCGAAARGGPYPRERSLFRVEDTNGRFALAPSPGAAGPASP